MTVVAATEASVGARIAILGGGILAPAGFRAGAASAGLRERSAADDVALLVANEPASAAGFFTRNLFAAAPVQLARQALASSGGRARAVVINAGCANAGTGAAGLAAAARVVEVVAERVGCAPDEVLPASTGLIGSALPADAVAAAAAQIELDVATPASASAAARAIMTTDTRAKEAAASVRIGTRTLTVGGMAKGSGMIHPGMATMIAVVTTDAPIEPATLRTLAAPIVERTFNQVSVDGDTSTNDTLFILASGAAGGEPVADGPSRDALALALEAVCTDLAQQIAADGEGATRRIDVTVTGAADDVEARLAARTIAASNLVKAAVHGADPNWGRIAAAAGRSGATLDPGRLQVWIGDQLTCAGRACRFDVAAARAALGGPVVTLRVDLGMGDGIGLAWGCDLSAEYVAINSEYAT
jgi:glutamate N-acetyltransferase / amino-acid N-acetyltransferase